MSAAASQMMASYETYYASDTYDARYPAANRRTLALVERLLDSSRSDEILDIGAGNGRYAIPLAIRRSEQCWAIERSEEGRRQLLQRASGLVDSGKVRLATDIAEVPTSSRSVRAALFMFGVLAHMEHTERHEVLRSLDRVALLIGSVPNLHRRFKNEARHATPDGPLGLPRITYRRDLEDDERAFEYTLFEPSTICSEMLRCGWRIELLAVESLLSESTVTSRPLIGRIDARLSSIAPPRLAYGLLFAARRSRAGS
jgi:cyclopropane fatty-acyl-phospholipid synthase-like methyltransferase